MTQTIRQLIDEQATWLVGRDDEMGVLRRLLGEGGPLVVFVHGIAGIGKSALVEAFGVEARAAGATVLRLDGRSIEPTERGFLAALEGKTGGELTTAEAAATRLDKLGAQLQEVSMPSFEYALSAYYLIAPAECSSNLARFDGVKYGHSDQTLGSLLETYLRTLRDSGSDAEFFTSHAGAKEIGAWFESIGTR